MRISPPSLRRQRNGFTMIEIALAIGIIGFALVAIIGILPRGMNAQKDNREDTIIGQDAPYFLNAIRNGEQRTNGGILTNYVESISILTNVSGKSGTITYGNPTLNSLTPADLTSDFNIIGLLSTPEFFPIFQQPNQTNTVTAIIRAMSGSAVQQNGANAATAFRYQMTVEIAPWNYSSSGYAAGSGDYLHFMGVNLREIRLRFAWPVYLLPDGSVQKIGDNRQTYRSLISSQMTNYFGTYWFCLPNTYSTVTNT